MITSNKHILFSSGQRELQVNHPYMFLTWDPVDVKTSKGLMLGPVGGAVNQMQVFQGTWFGVQTQHVHLQRVKLTSDDQ